MTPGFSLKDHLFNRDSLTDLGREYAAGVPGFDAHSFVDQAVAGLDDRGLMERLDWIADCVEARLAPDFPTMADQLEAAMPPALDTDLTDDDFGRFIHAVPGILAVRHGIGAAHRDRALALLEEATKRFSMEFYIRPFLNRWPEETLAKLREWCGHPNYHVRRLASEGTRPKLPWAKALEIDPLVPLPILTRLHADPTRYVTRSVANHMNDIAKIDPGLVLATLAEWRAEARQDPRELDWMTRHALRTLVKQGHPDAMAMLGYAHDAPVRIEALTITPGAPRIGGTAEIAVTLATDAAQAVPVLVDYVIWFRRPGGAENAKVFKMKQAEVQPGAPLRLTKNHRFKGDATTYSLVPGPHRLAVQVNGRVLAEIGFDLVG